jgi:gas vesicle protein
MASILDAALLGYRLVDQGGCAMIRMAVVWVETVHGVDGEARRKMGQRHSELHPKTETVQHELRRAAAAIPVDAKLHRF